MDGEGNDESANYVRDAGNRISSEVRASTTRWEPVVPGAVKCQGNGILETGEGNGHLQRTASRKIKV